MTSYRFENFPSVSKEKSSSQTVVPLSPRPVLKEEEIHVNESVSSSMPTPSTNILVILLLLLAMDMI